MNWLDALLAVMFVVALIQGLRTGLVKSVISLAGLVLGLWLAAKFYLSFGSWLHNFIADQSVANIAAFATILLASLLVSTVISSLLGGLVSAIGLGWLNALGGAVFSLVLAAVMLGSLLAVLLEYSFYSGLEEAIRSSFLARLLLDRFPLVLGLLPGEFDSIRDLFPHPSPQY